MSQCELAYDGRQMKRILLRILLITLVLAEIWLLTGFLPQRWQENIDTRLRTVWPSHSYNYSQVTHPNLDTELQPFKPLGMALLAVLVVINGGFIAVFWTQRKGKWSIHSRVYRRRNRSLTPN